MDPKALTRLFVAHADGGNYKAQGGRQNEGRQGKEGRTGYSRRRRMTVRPKLTAKLEGGKKDLRH